MIPMHILRIGLMDSVHGEPEHQLRSNFARKHRNSSSNNPDRAIRIVSTLRKGILTGARGS